MKRLFIPGLWMGMILLSLLAHGQPDAQRIWMEQQDTAYFRLSLGYTSDYLYMGRADPVKSPYLSTTLVYDHPSGVYVKSGVSYLTGPETRQLDLISLALGYRASSHIFDAGGSLTGLFFNDDSYTVQSEMKGLIKAYGGIDLSWMMIYLDAGVGWSEKTDVFTGVEVNHTIYLVKRKLRITPALYINWGSQHYYDSYYSYRHSQFGKEGHGHGQQPTPVAMITDAQRFQLLDYEAECRMSYILGRARMQVGWIWTFPVHPATFVDDQGISQTEILQNGFCWYAGTRFML